MMLIPSQGVAIVVLTNTWPSRLSNEIADRVAAAVTPHWEVRSPPSAAGQRFAPPPSLIGTWIGHVLREEGDLPVALTVKGDGSAVAKVGDQVEAPIKDISFEAGRLGGALATSLLTEDSARYHYTVRLDMKLASDRLYGEATALDCLSNPTFAAALTHWIDLKRGR
jgi:hypothetical protein